MPKCAMTGIEVDSGTAIWDDGEWISWEWINAQLHEAEEDHAYTIEPFISREGHPYSIIEHTEIFHDLVDCCLRYFENTGRYLQLWGELGEMYAEIKFGLRRHGSCHPGSDGTIDGRRVEVKTISPEKTSRKVSVKTKGDFEQLLIVRIDSEFAFRGVLIDRAALQGAGEGGQHYRARFPTTDQAPEDETQRAWTPFK